MKREREGGREREDNISFSIAFLFFYSSGFKRIEREREREEEEENFSTISSRAIEHYLILDFERKGRWRGTEKRKQ